MKKIKSVLAVALCVFFISVSAAGSELYSDIRFREFPRDRDIFERYTEEADRSTSAEEWQRIVDSGKEEMTAVWERNAIAECDRYIREGFNPDQVQEGMEEARAEWENAFNDALLYEKGVWRATQGISGYITGSMTGLQERVNDADNAELADTAAWDSFVAGAVKDAESSWESIYTPEIEKLYTHAETLTGKEKDGFLAETGKIENELRRSFDVEKDTILYLGKTGFIEKNENEVSSLREESERKSASAITNNIIADAESQIRSEEDKILEKTYSPGSVSTVDFSGLGENWQEDLKKLVDYGMSKWEAARENLYNEIISWKKTAVEAYETAEAKWREGLQKLEAARFEWEKQLTAEIYAGLEEWERGNAELQGNIEQSRQDFSEYMESMSGQWSDSNRNLVDMAVNGSAVYADATDNIKWLEEMILQYEPDKFTFKEYNDAFQAAIGADLSNLINTAVTLNSKSNSRVEVHVTPSGSPVYTDEIKSVTESYTINIIRYDRVKTSSILNIYHEEAVPVSTLTWSNVVTAESSADRRSTYCYYLLELGRWESIQKSFSTIARDAEFYMHNENMTGNDDAGNKATGPGYLTNASGLYTTNTGSQADPYLMTQAEYNLELAERDRDFWQGRLDIAKSVLDYAEDITKETSADTERNMNNAMTVMEDSKGAYNAALAAVTSIVNELRAIQGAGSLTDPGYQDSIQALTDRYNIAREQLKTVEEAYIICKTKIIYLRNNEDPAAIRKQITEIERDMLIAEQQVNKAREDYYIKQNEAEFASRTAAYAVLYNNAIKSYEQAKDRSELIRNIVSSTGNDTACIDRADRILSVRDIIWGADAAERSQELETLRDAYSSLEESDPARDLKRDRILAYIRDLYFLLQADVELKRNIIESLRDESYIPQDFLTSEYTGDHELYTEYAGYSSDALDIVDECFEQVEDAKGKAKSYASVLELLQEKFKGVSYVYGADNSGFIKQYTALKYFEADYRGLDETTWEIYRSRLSSERDASEMAGDAHTDMAEGDAAVKLLEMENRASLGDVEAVAWLREYYVKGSAIAGLEYIQEYDCRADAAEYVNSALMEYVAENVSWFYNREKFEEETGFISQIYGYIVSLTGIGEGTGDNLPGIEAFRNMTPEEISSAAGALQSYVADFDSKGIPVPDAIRSAAETIAGIKEELDIKLFIQSYMSSSISGTPDSLLEDASKHSDDIAAVQEFINTCADLIDSSNGLLINNNLSIDVCIRNTYEQLSDAQKDYISNSDNRIKSINEFVAGIYEVSYNFELARYEKQYADTASDVKPEEAASFLPDNMRARFIADMQPVYERAQYDIAFSEGKVNSIIDYIKSRNLDSVTENTLRNYALIKYYNESVVQGTGGYDSAFKDYESYGKTDPSAYKFLPVEVKVYLAEKLYYEKVYLKKTITNNIEALIRDEYGSDSVDGDVADAVERYAGRLNAVLFFRGDAGAYISSLDPDAAQYLQMYINGGTMAVLPGFEYGIYRESDDPLYTAKLQTYTGALKLELDYFANNYYQVMDILDDDIENAGKEMRRACAQLVATKLGFHYLDSGALYRIVAFAAKQKNIAWSDAIAVTDCAKTLSIEFVGEQVLLNHQDVSSEIRTEEIGKGASQVAVHAPLRAVLVDIQHSFCKAPGLVADGRDMGTVIFPDAELKVFLTASTEIRALRRYKQLLGKNQPANYENILQDLTERDARDKGRASAPLLMAGDAILLETDNLGISDAVDFILQKYQILQNT